ncbi:hypothetical protein D3C87_1903560 [compost metagenome]
MGQSAGDTDSDHTEFLAPPFHQQEHHYKAEKRAEQAEEQTGKGAEQECGKQCLQNNKDKGVPAP